MFSATKSVRAELLSAHPVGGDSELENKKAGWINKQVIPCDSYLLINIDKQNPKAFKTQTEIKQRQLIKVLPFEVNGINFDKINGNFSDKLVLDQISYKQSVNSFRFKFHSGANSKTFQADLEWSQRLFTCIENGLTNIIEFNDATTDSYSSCIVRLTNQLVTLFCCAKNLSDRIPMCDDFAGFMSTGIKSTNDLCIQWKKIHTTELISKFSCIGIMDGKKPLHVFIHIEDSICISKLGEGPIVFHTIDSIKEYYESIFSKPLDLANFNYYSMSKLSNST